MSADAGDPASGKIEKYAEYVRSLQEFEFRPPDFEVTGSDAVEHLGVALLQLAQTVERRFQGYTHLLEVMEQVNHGLLINDVLDYVFDSFRSLIPYDRIGYAAIEDDGNTVCAQWARSDSPCGIRIRKGFSQPMAGSSLRHIIDTGQPRVINDLEAYYAEHPDSPSTGLALAEGIRSSLTCPLIAMGTPIGFLFFSNCEKFTYQDLHKGLFMRIAGILSAIIEKGRLYEQLLQRNRELTAAREALQYHATHDDLTGLWNRRAIMELVHKELSRAQRAHRPVATILLDIDNFKSINDRFGHQIGDEVLKESARRLGDTLRAGDSLGRYGGEEFIVVLHTENVTEANMTAERLLGAVAGEPFGIQGHQLSVGVSIGIGFAMEAVGVDLDTLVQLADEALYQAKSSGKNRVCRQTASGY